MYKVQAQDSDITPSATIVIISPEPGQILKGTVLIQAETYFDAPTSVKLSFSYAADPRETWFLIQEYPDIDQQELSFEWDTTTITDGDYAIRFTAGTGQGEHSTSVTGLRVRNYTAVETSTPLPTATPAPQDTLAPSITPTRTTTPIPPTATALPPNPAQITTNDIWNSIIIGTLIALGILGILGVFQLVRKHRRNRD
jgi:hypothetical protein